MMCDRHLSLPDPCYQQAKSASRAGCHSSFRSMTIKQEHAASDWNQLALYRSNIGDTRMCDVSRAAQGSLGVQGEHLSSLPSMVTAPTPCTCWLCMVAGGNTIRHVNLTLDPPCLSAGARLRNEAAGEKKSLTEWETAGCQLVPQRRFISPVVKFISRLQILCFVSGRDGEDKVTPPGSRWKHVTFSAAHYRTNDFCNNRWVSWSNFNLKFIFPLYCFWIVHYKVVMLTSVHENAFNIHWYPLIKLKSIEVFCFYFQKKEKAYI